MAYNTAQNTSFLTIASIGQKIISFAYFTFIARTIGIANTGEYFAAIVFTSIFTTLADFGLGPILTREAAKYPENSQAYFSTVLFYKTIFGLLAYGMILFLVTIIHYPGTIRPELILLSGITMFFDNLQSAFYSIFRAHKNLFYESLGIILSQAITLVIGSIAVFVQAPLYWLIIAYAIPSFLNVGYAAFFVRKNYQLKLTFVFDKAFSLSLLSLAWPFALASLSGRLYSYADSLIMLHMLSKQELGWWSVPYKIAFAFQFIPAAFSASIYPAISGLFLKDPLKITALYQKAFKYLLVILVPIMVGIIVLARPIIIHWYGISYLPSIVPLQILLSGAIFSFLSVINGAVLNGTNKQKTQTSIIFTVLVINIILNLILLPIMSIQGAAVAYLVSNFILFALGYYFVQKQIVVEHAVLARNFLFIFLNSAIMGVIVFAVAQRINFYISIVIGAIVFAIGLFWLRIFKKTEIMDVKNRILHRTSKI